MPGGPGAAGCFGFVGSALCGGLAHAGAHAGGDGVWGRDQCAGGDWGGGFGLLAQGRADGVGGARGGVAITGRLALVAQRGALAVGALARAPARHCGSTDQRDGKGGFERARNRGVEPDRPWLHLQRGQQRAGHFQRDRGLTFEKHLPKAGRAFQE